LQLHNIRDVGSQEQDDVFSLLPFEDKIIYASNSSIGTLMLQRCGLQNNLLQHFKHQQFTNTVSASFDPTSVAYYVEINHRRNYKAFYG